MRKILWNYGFARVYCYDAAAMHREPLSHQRRALGPATALLAALLLAGALPAPLHAQQDPQPQQPAAPAAPASPSAPPFWARPKPSATACPCDAAPAGVVETADNSGLLTGMLAGAALVLLALFVRQRMRKPEP